MKCPKCGYVSHDYLERCKSCAEDLVPAKIKLNIYTIQPVIGVDDDGFAVEKVEEDRKDLLGGGAPPKKGRDVSLEDVLKDGEENLESFDFGEDEKA
jgi:hypothetical protein